MGAEQHQGDERCSAQGPFQVPLLLLRPRLARSSACRWSRPKADTITRTEFDSTEVDNEVLIPTKDNNLRVGDFAEVRITKANEHDSRGEVA